MTEPNPNYHDGTLQQGQAFASVSQTVLLQSDGLAVDPGIYTLIYIGSDNTTASNRTFTLSASNVGAGHEVMIEFNTGSSTTCELADSGNCKLTAPWTPVQYDTLTLVFDGTYWVEKARGSTTGGNSIPLANTQILVGNSSNLAAAVAMSGDATIDNAGAVTIANSAVTNAKVSASAAIAFSKLAALTDGNILVGSGANVATAVAMSGDATISNAGALTIANSAVTNAKVSGSAAIDFSKLATLTSGNILVGSAGNVATSVAMSGDATIAATGAVTIAANAVSISKLATSVMVEATGTLTQANIIAMGVTPVTLIADPSAGVGLIVDEVELFHSYSTAAYTGGGDVSLEYSDGTDIVLYADSIVTGGSSLKSVVRPTIYDLDASTGSATGFAIVAAKGVQITNAGGAFADGNAANEIKWRVRYHLVTLLT